MARNDQHRALPLWIALVALGAFGPDRAHAQESALEQAPAPSDVREGAGPLGRSLRERQRRPTLFPPLKAHLQGLPAFLRDTELLLETRSFYLNRRGDTGRSEAWAVGGALDYRSGWLAERFALGATLHTSQRLVGKRSEDGTLLLEPRQEGYTVLGRAYAVLRHGEHRLTLYRQALDLPYVNGQDSRMTPNTFEGYTARGSFRELPKIGSLDYIGGYLTRMKTRNNDDFDPMSQVAGVPGVSNHGMALGGLRLRPREGSHLGVLDYFVPDTINIAYVEAEHSFEPAPDWGVRLGAQFTHQRSVGERELGRFDTWVAGGRISIAYREAILGLGFSTTDRSDAIRSPFGSYPGFVSLILSDFDAADEDAWRVSLSYGFGRLGLPALSAALVYAEGHGARGSGVPDEREFDATLDYRVETGVLRGFWLRFRAAILDRDGSGRNTTDLRVIVNYELPVL